jgi:hypothetical protein
MKLTHEVYLRLKRGFIKLSVLVILLGIISLFSLKLFQAQADDGAGGREKIIEVVVTEYTWELVSKSTGNVTCEITIEHKGLPSDVEVATICAQFIPSTLSSPTPPLPITEITPQVGPTPFNLESYLRYNFWRFSVTKNVTRYIKITLPDILVYVDVPNIVVIDPYVNITAYDPVPEYTILSIHGLDNGKEFECAGSKCKVPLTGDTFLELWAKSSSGDESVHVKAEIRVISTGEGKQVILSYIAPAVIYNDTCEAIWKAKPQTTTTWASFPPSPDQLNTNKKLFYLTSRLIATGIVQADECPNNGLFSTNSPNSCGMDKARTAMINWQNQYDPAIWVAAKDVGVPPRVIKTLIELETQFWPVNTQYLLLEYGLAQINELGADVILRWDDTMYSEVCKELLFDCTTPYINLPGWQQALLRGGLMQMINADCPSCVNGVDPLKTSQSINIIAHTLQANCTQAKHILDLTKSTTTYEDFWRFALVSYHSGYQCLLDAVDTTKNLNEPMDWEHVSSHLDCETGQTYVDDFFYSLENFDANRLTAATLPDEYTSPFFVPTPTPAPTPTPILSRGAIRVLAYIDQNNNGIAEINERVNEVIVQATFVDGTTISQNITNGEAVLSMAGRVAGTNVTIAMQNFYRSYVILIPESGETLVVFRLEQPLLPKELP